MYSVKNSVLVVKKKKYLLKERVFEYFFCYDYDNKYSFDEFDISLYQGTHGDELSVQSDMVCLL